MKKQTGWCIEISAYKYPILKDAQAEAESIVNARKNKLEAARKPYHNAVKEAADFKRKIDKYEAAVAAGEETIPTISRMVGKELVDFTLEEAKKEYDMLVDFVEKCRIAKQAAVKALHIKAYQTFPLTYGGKHGGNYRFLHTK